MSKRPNGTGYIYPRGKTWTARVVDHYEPAPGTKTGLRPKYKTKGGFTKKKDAINYIASLLQEKRHEHPSKSFKANYDEWEKSYSSRVSAKTMEGYKLAFAHFKSLHYVKIDQISANDLQKAIDDCSCGKRTKQVMKVVAGLVYKYAIDDDQIIKNNAENLYIENEETTHYEALTEQELNTIAASGEQYADYIVAMSYMGHRPTEFFGFKKSDYYTENGVNYIAGGIKSEAGKHRIVPIPARIQPIIDRRLAVEGTDLLFPRYDYYHQGKREGEFKGFSHMPTRYFNTDIFKPLTERLGITGKVAYSTRHTYSNKIKNVSGSDKDKASLMGHASYETTKKHYQSTNLDELKAITDQIK